MEKIDNRTVSYINPSNSLILNEIKTKTNYNEDNEINISNIFKNIEDVSPNQKKDTIYKVQNLIEILKLKSNYSKTFTIWSLLERINTICNTDISVNKLNMNNISKQLGFGFNKVLLENITNQNIDFLEFINKSIICMSNNIYEEIFFKINNDNISSLSSNFINKFPNTVNPYYMIVDILYSICKELKRNLNNSNEKLYMQIGSLNFDKIKCSNDCLKNFSNKLINTRNFEYLRLLIGDNLFKYILLKTTIFVFDEQAKNYIQVTGRSLKEEMIELLNAQSMNKYVSLVSSNNLISQNKFSNNNYNINNQLNYKLNNHKTTKNTFNKNIIPIQSFIVERNKIFYCHNFNRKMGLFKGNLKSKDIKNNKSLFLLNRFFDQYLYIVPENIKLIISDYCDIIIKNLEKYDYVYNLNLFCPNYFEEKKQYNTTDNNSSINSNINVFKYKNIKTYIKNLYNECKIKAKDIDSMQYIYEKLLNTTIDRANIFLFLKDFLKKIIPLSFIGKNNLNFIINKLYMFISLNRFETFNKITLFEKKEFDFNEIKWLNTAFKMKKSDYNMKKLIQLKNFIMKNIIFNIYDFFVVQILRSHFYITEKQGSNYKVFYYHKCNWNILMKITELKFSSKYSMIAQNAAIDKLRDNDSAYGKLRIVPKNSTYRPIVSYKKKTIKSRKFLKNELYQTNKIFKYISQKMQSNKKNCVVFDYKQIISNLIKFKEAFNIKKSFKNKNVISSNLIESNKYVDEILNFCNMDIEACYDNICIKKLCDILDNEDIISEDYLSTVIFVLLPKANILCNKYKENSSLSNLKECFEIKKLYMVTEVSDYIHYLDLIRNKSDLNYTYCIVYDDFKNTNFIRKEEFIPKIKNILNNNVIRFNKKYFLQTKGIPQGLSISSFLCNLYFYNLEKEVSKCYNLTASKYPLVINEARSNHLKITLKKENSLLMRFMDDYILMTTNKFYVTEVILKLYSILMRYDSNFNMKKSKNNIPDLTIEVINNKTFNLNFKQITNTYISNNPFEKYENIKKCKKTINQLNKEEYNKISTNASWNGMSFNFISGTNIFNVVMEGKEEYDLSKYSSLINVNIPIEYKNNLEWLYKKMSSIFLTGHPWIYFIQKLTNKECLEKNFDDLIRNIFFKLIILFNTILNTGLTFSQKKIIKVTDDCVKKLFLYFSHKLSRYGEAYFYIDNYYKFNESFYERLLRLYICSNSINKKYNSYIISLCPFLFKIIRRKVYRIKKHLKKLNISKIN